VEPQRSRFSIPKTGCEVNSLDEKRFVFHIVEERMSQVVLIAIAAMVLGCCNALAETGNGSPQERTACSRDASRLCRKQMADGDNAVQQCLQQNRQQLGRACRKVFQDHGM
jgi:hypothetical protein